MPVCPKCGIENPQDAVYCTACGAEMGASADSQNVAAPKAFCARCGSQVALGVPFCPSCGAATDGTASPAPNNSSPVKRVRVPRRAVWLAVAVVVVVAVAGLVVWKLQPSPAHRRVEAAAGFLQALYGGDANTVLKYAPDDVAKSIDSVKVQSDVAAAGVGITFGAKNWSGDTLRIPINNGSGVSATLVVTSVASDSARLTISSVSDGSEDAYAYSTDAAHPFQLMPHTRSS